MSHPPPGVPLGGDVVTGEAVVLEVRLAKLPSRSLAVVIDLTVQVLALLGLLMLSAAGTAGLDPAATDALVLVVVVGVVVGYPTLVETLTSGRSLGKLVLGLRVVRDDGGPVRFRQAVTRALMGVIEIWATFGAVAVLASLASAQGKRVGDHLAGTVVVRERMPVRGAPMVQMPLPLAPWAATLDLSRLPDDLALSARTFLARAPELRPDVRGPMAWRIASDVARCTTPPPPSGTPPEAFLAAVLAERRRREWLRQAPPTPPPTEAAPPPPAPPPSGLVPPA